MCLSDKVNTTKSATAVHSYDLKNNILFNKKLLFKSNKPSNSSRHFGCRLAIIGEFIFATGITGQLKNEWAWPVQQTLAILSLDGDKVMKFSDQGAMQINVDSGLATYEYILPAQSK